MNSCKVDRDVEPSTLNPDTFLSLNSLATPLLQSRLPVGDDWRPALGAERAGHADVDPGELPRGVWVCGDHGRDRSFKGEPDAVLLPRRVDKVRLYSHSRDNDYR